MKVSFQPLTIAVAAMVALTSVIFAPKLNAEILYGMTAADSLSGSGGQNLVFFDSSTPSAITTVGAFTGLLPGHKLLEIDFRPANGQLYAISTSNSGTIDAQIYTVNLNTAALTPVGSTFTLTNSFNRVAAIDFDPQADLLRIVTQSAHSYRWNPVTTAFVQEDTRIVYGAGDSQAGFNPDLVGVAYSNNVSGAGFTTMYGWDFRNDTFLRIGGINGAPSPNLGQAFTILTPGGLRTFFEGIDMDISGATGIAYVTHDDPSSGSSMGLYTIDLTTGAETFVGTYGAGMFITSISAIPEPSHAAFLIGVLATCLGSRRRD